MNINNLEQKTNDLERIFIILKKIALPFLVGLVVIYAVWRVFA